MKRDVIDFNSFKKNFIDAPWGYHPVDSAITENNNGEYEKSVDMDMICRWRLGDGKVKFIVVPFETEQQLSEITTWLLKAAESLEKEITESVLENVVSQGKELFNE